MRRRKPPQRDVDERLNEEMSAVVKDEDETKNKKFLFSLKSNVFRTASMKARARGESMRWVDRLASTISLSRWW